MKPFLFRFVLTWVVFCPYLRGEGSPSAPVPSADNTTQETVVPIGPGEFVPPAPKPPIPSVPESEVIQRSRVFQGGRFVTTEELVPLDEPPAVEQTAVPAPTPEEIAADRAEWLEESRAHPEVMLSLSGTVYDHKATLLRWRNGDEEFQAWSNIDFNVMRGMSSVEVGSTTYVIFMMIGDESTTPSIVKSGVVIAPKLPKMNPALCSSKEARRTWLRRAASRNSMNCIGPTKLNLTRPTNSDCVTKRPPWHGGKSIRRNQRM